MNKLKNIFVNKQLQTILFTKYMCRIIEKLTLKYKYLKKKLSIKFKKEYGTITIFKVNLTVSKR